MKERFTLENTVNEIIENERVNKKLPIFFDLTMCHQIKWPFSKMKLKNMMKMTKFPGQTLIDAANLILERREAGAKITIPIWRGLPSCDAEKASYTVLIPFVADDQVRPAVLICPEWKDGRLQIMDEALPVAMQLSDLSCHAFILNLRADSEAEDMARAIRFMHANHEKLHIDADKIALIAFGEMKLPARKLLFHSKRIKDITHRYDNLKCEPEELWIIGPPDEDADKPDVFFGYIQTPLTEADCSWLKERATGLNKEKSENHIVTEETEEGEL